MIATSWPKWEQKFQAAGANKLSFMRG